MRTYPDTILNVIADSELNLNNISKLSGVSNTYLTKLSKGQINHPGKDKIASILLAMNYSIGEINEILAQYDYQGLNKYDIPAILVNNQRRRIAGRMLPIYERLHFELLLAVFESYGGTKVVIKGRPTASYQPYNLYMLKEFQLEVGSNVAQFHYDLTAAVVKERLRLFRENCRKGDKAINYICGHCLSDELDRNLGQYVPEDDESVIQLFAQYYANAIASSIKFPEQHQIHIVDRCPSFEMVLHDAEGTKPIINFTGSGPHMSINPYDQHNLRGFFTSSSSMLTLINTEVEMCKASINPDDPRNKPLGLREYVANKFEEWGVRNHFDQAIEQLLSEPDHQLF